MIIFPTRQPAIEVLPGYMIVPVDQSSPLFGKVSLFFQFSCSEFHEINMVPDGSYDMLFFFSENKVNAWLYGSVREVQPMPFERECDCFGMRFYPGVCSSLFPIRLANFSGRIPFFLGDKEELVYERMAAATFEERMAFITDLMAPTLTEITTEPVAAYCTSRILETSGMVTIKELAAETGYSDTWIRNCMVSNVGFKPKEFGEIIRFQHSLRYLFKDRVSLSYVAQESGFFDQSQMNRAYQRYVHTNPSLLIEELHRIYKKEDK